MLVVGRAVGRGTWSFAFSNCRSLGEAEKSTHSWCLAWGRLPAIAEASLQTGSHAGLSILL